MDGLLEIHQLGRFDAEKLSIGPSELWLIHQLESRGIQCCSRELGQWPAQQSSFAWLTKLLGTVIMATIHSGETGIGKPMVRRRILLDS